jgi:hypothetical protein
MVAATRRAQYLYQPRHGQADGKAENRVPPSEVVSESLAGRDTITVDTNDPSTDAYVTTHNAAFGHRDNFTETPDPTQCAIRLRLTPSQPFKRGAVWRHEPGLVLKGFDTEFTWQVGDHSRICHNVKDAAFDGNLYSSCAVHGGDGFAFVVHVDPNGTDALGAGGGGVGYAGIRWGVAIELDTLYNPELGDGAPLDHFQVQGRGPDPLTADETSRLAAAAYVDVADGAVHRMRVAYYPYLKEEFLPQFSMTTAAIQFAKDEGEGRRLGTLVVWVDAPEFVKFRANDSSAAFPAPTLAIPMNLGTALSSPQGFATLGFTSATGRSFERHDVLSWRFCEEPECARQVDAQRQAARNGAASGSSQPPRDEVEGIATDGFDYHRESNA